MGDAEPATTATEKRSRLAVKPEAPLAATAQQDKKSDEVTDESSAKAAKYAREYFMSRSIGIIGGLSFFFTCVFSSDEQLFDRSIATAPGGFIGKVCCPYISI